MEWQKDMFRHSKIDPVSSYWHVIALIDGHDSLFYDWGFIFVFIVFLLVCLFVCLFMFVCLSACAHACIIFIVFFCLLAVCLFIYSSVYYSKVAMLPIVSDAPCFPFDFVGRICTIGGYYKLSFFIMAALFCARMGTIHQKIQWHINNFLRIGLALLL